MSYNPILLNCDTLVKLIDDFGEQFENTRELIEGSVGLYLLDTATSPITCYTPESMKAALVSYYGEEKWARRYEAEKFHYEQLKYALLHKVEELHYFHKTPLENRKTIIFSNDCISSIQFLKRGSEARLLVHMRSSDVKELLPMDLWALTDIFWKVVDYYTRENPRIPFTSAVQKMSMHVTIGSAHYYTSGGRE